MFTEVMEFQRSEIESGARISKVPIKVMKFHYFWEPGSGPPPKMSTEVMEFQRSEIESGAQISKVPIKVMEFHYFWVPGRCPPQKRL